MMREVNREVKKSIRKMNKQLKVRPSKIEQVIDLREEILNDIWACNKKVVDGKWYVELSQVCDIVGGKQ